MDSQAVVKDFVEGLKELYRDRLVSTEEQWPPVRGDKLVKLQLVEEEKTEGFRGGLSQQDKVKRTPILHGNLFTVEHGKKPVRKLIVEGNAGMGKTTLCTMIAEEWAEGRIMTQFDCVLFLPLREELVSSAKSLSDLLKLLHDSKSICSIVTDHIERRRGKGVLIIADGWDELEQDKRSKRSFLYKLLFGHCLRLASVLLTSRPSASAPLHDLTSVDRLVEVVGFNKESIKQYIESEFESCPEKASSLIKQLENNPLIESVCSVPLNCAITCNLWRTSGQMLPVTLTELYTQVVLNIIFRDIKKKFPECPISLSLNNFDSIPEHLQKNFWVTCKFAYECLLRNQIVFTEDELTRFFPEALDSSDQFLCFGLLQSARSIIPVGHGLSFHFLHLTFQEYLAALHFSTLPKVEQLKVCKSHIDSSRFAMVWRFVFGLGYQAQSSCGATVSKKVAGIDDKVVDHFVSYRIYRRLLLCHCALESKSDIISIRIARRIRGRFGTPGIAHTPHDCTSVFHVLRHTSPCPHVSIGLSECGLSDKLLMELTKILFGAGGDLNIVKLDLRNNKLSDIGVTDLFRGASSSFSSLDNLSLDGNNINDAMAAFTYTSCNSLTFLSLSHNPLGVSGTQSLERSVQAGVLVKLQYLSLSNILTDDADVNGALLCTLLTSLASQCPHLELLDLSDNNLGVPGACVLGQVFPLLSNNSKQFCLDLNETNLNTEALTAFSECATSMLSPLASSLSDSLAYSCELVLSRNPLGYGGLLALFRMLSSECSQITELQLIDTDLTTLHRSIQDANAVRVDFLGGKIRSLKYLSVSGNIFNGDRVLVLAELISVCQSLEVLASIACSLTSSGIISLFSRLKSAGSSCNNLREWYLQGNSIDNTGVISLIDCIPDLFPSLERVWLNGNPVSRESTGRLEGYLTVNRETNWARQRAVREAKRSAVLFDWQRTYLPPQSEELLQVFFEMWDELLRMLFLMADEILNESGVSEDEPTTDQQSTQVSPQLTAGSDERYHSTTEVSAGLNLTATAESTCPTVQPLHLMGEHNTCVPEVSNPSTSSISDTATVLTSSTPELHSSGIGGLRIVTIDELRAHRRITETQLDRQVQDKDLYTLASYFENVDTYIVSLGLSVGQQTDVRDLAFRRGTQTAMCEALRLWREPNPYQATYRCLVRILLSMGKGSVADQVCYYLSSTY